MTWPIFSSTPHRVLGIDVGTAAVRVVELSRDGTKVKLDNYGEIQSKFLYERPFRDFKKNNLSISTKDVARAISSIIKEAGMRTRLANFSLPDFSSFFTSFTL